MKKLKIYLMFFFILFCACNTKQSEREKEILCVCEINGWDKRKMIPIAIKTLDKKTIFLGSSTNTLLDNYNSKFWRIPIKERYFPESLDSTDWRLKCKGDREYERFRRKKGNFFGEKFVFADSILISYELELSIYSKSRIKNYMELKAKSNVSLPPIFTKIRLDKDSIFVNDLFTVKFEQYYEPSHQEYHVFQIVYSYDYEKLYYDK